MKPNNPLANFMRQPKIYIKLPSNGLYWEDSSLAIPENGEFPVYSMTAKDELTFKTPDALMNGQAVVDVIQSCLPNIKNAWATPNLDLDVILIAIRIATYGEKMEISHTVPNTNETIEHEIDLRVILDQVMSKSTWEEVIEINDQLTFYVKPLTYRHLTKTALKTFETQKIMQAVNDDSLSEEKKLEIFSKSFKEMTSITVNLISDSIFAIQTPDTVVKEERFIKEFIENADIELIDKVKTHIDNLRSTIGIQPITIQSSDEHVKLGAPKTYELPISMDNSNFFVRGS